jgi:hypothetical protein
VTSATKPARKSTARRTAPVAKKVVAKKATAPVAKKAVAKKAPAKVAKKAVAKKAPAKKVVAKKAVARKPALKRVAVVVAPEPVAPPAPKVATPKPLVDKERARRKVVLPFRERLEEAMHRELKHVGPVCHVCRMNGSRLAALASMPAVVAV